MERDMEKKIREDLEQVTAYRLELKSKIWGNIKQEIQNEQEGEKTMKNRNKKILRAVLVATLCGAFMGGTVFAKPILNELIAYFGEQKVKQVHDIQNDTFIQQQAKLYESAMGYMTYYDEAYFEVTQENGVDYFRAKNDEDTYLEVTLEKGKDFETVLFEETGKKLEDISVFLFDEYAVEVQYEDNAKKAGWEAVTMLCDGEELGIFVIKANYNKENTATVRMYHDIANEFIPLYEKNRERIAQGKPQLHFEYNQEEYELAQYSSENHRIYLQKKGVDVPDYMSDILLTYAHYIDESPKQKVIQVLKTHEENRRISEKHLEELEAEGKKHPDSSLTTIKEVTNDLKVDAKKLIETKNNDGTIQYITYFIEDGQGGCYEVYIYLPKHEDLQDILESIEIQEPTSLEMEYRIIVDKALG